MMYPMKNLLLHQNLKPHPQQRKASKASLLVHRIHDVLILLSNPKNPHHQKKLFIDLHRLLQEIHFLLYGDADTEPVQKACTEAALEFFKDKHNPINPFLLLLKFFPQLEWDFKRLASQIVVNLVAQPLPSSSLLISAEYLEDNMELVDLLVTGLFDHIENNSYVGLMYGLMLRECLCRSQAATKHVLDSKTCINKFLHYVTCPNYTFAAHVEDTLELLLTRHKTTVAQFLLRDYEWFFEEFNSKLLVSSNTLTKARGFKMMREMLLEGKNHSVKLWYVSSLENLKLHMNALRESKWVQLEAFQVFKLFLDNPDMPRDVAGILRLNKTKLLRFMDGFKPSHEDEAFEADKARVVRDISMLEEVDCKPMSLAGHLRIN